MLTIATRGSALARWQAGYVSALLRGAAAVTAGGASPGADGGVDELVIVKTSADQRVDVPIWDMGGKGVFVKEVQAAVLDGRARLAVHSAKDLPSLDVPGLVLAAVPERADPRDVLVGGTLDGLPAGACVATGSVRRRAQLAYARPDLTFAGLRGNIATRLERIPEGGAIVMAAAAIERLGLWPTLEERSLRYEVLSSAVMAPQVGQGALAIECREDDTEAREALAAIEHPASRVALDAERAFLRELGGDCDLPAGAFATVDERTGEVTVDGLLASLDGHVVLRERLTGVGADADALGRRLAAVLLDRGGRSLLGV